MKSFKYRGKCVWSIWEFSILTSLMCGCVCCSFTIRTFFYIYQYAFIFGDNQASLSCFPLWILHHFFLCLYRKTLWRLYSIHFLSFHFHRNYQTPAVRSSRETPFVKVTNSYPSLFILCDWTTALITPFPLKYYIHFHVTTVSQLST